MSNNGTLSYPEELKQEFIETNDINYGDGTTVTAAEVWKFMTQVAPKKFPYAFDRSINNDYFLSDDVEYFSGIKVGYLTHTLKDLLLKKHNKGAPLIHVIGGQLMDAYYAAGGVAFRNALVFQAVRDTQEGANLRTIANYEYEILERGKKTFSYELCHGALRNRAIIDEEIVPVDMIAPYQCLRCSDLARMIESYRDKYPTFSVDIPTIEYENKEWAVNYLTSQLHSLVQKISKMSGKEMTDKDFIEEIKLENKARKLAREIHELWWSAKVPPTNSTDFNDASQLAIDFKGDPLAAVGILEEIKKETKDRIKHSVLGKGLDDDPVRLYVSGMGGPKRRRVDEAGAVVVGSDQSLNPISVHVKETGDPYENLARGTLSLPIEQTIQKRAELAAEQVKKSRADGAIVTIVWGCNYTSAVTRILADTIKEHTGVPTFIFESTPGNVEGVEQTETRSEAFIEMLKLRVK